MASQGRPDDAQRKHRRTSAPLPTPPNTAFTPAYPANRCIGLWTFVDNGG
jgi:hypothetical protein